MVNVSQSPDDEAVGYGQWNVIDTDAGLIELSFENLMPDGVETFGVELAPSHARALAAALIEFADELE